jgi:hypothetical protein
MPKLEKPERVEITVRNGRAGESKSFTVYDISVKEALKILRQVFERKSK